MTVCKFNITSSGLFIFVGSLFPVRTATTFHHRYSQLTFTEIAVMNISLNRKSLSLPTNKSQ